MSDAPLVKAIEDRLRQAGYVDVSTPFRVATVSFEFTAAMRGRAGRSLDLVLLVDTTTGDYGDRDSARVRQRVEALSRALDITKSRYVITVILAGAVLAGDIESLSETCRVLNVEMLSLNSEGRPVDEAAAKALDDRIRLLLPLSIPPSLDLPLEAGGSAINALLADLPKNAVDETLLASVIAASVSGEEAVQQAMSKILESALRLDGEPG
jgi:hypothetical protein